MAPKDTGGIMWTRLERLAPCLRELARASREGEGAWAEGWGNWQNHRWSVATDAATERGIGRERETDAERERERQREAEAERGRESSRRQSAPRVCRDRGRCREMQRQREADEEAVWGRGGRSEGHRTEGLSRGWLQSAAYSVASVRRHRSHHPTVPMQCTIAWRSGEQGRMGERCG